MAPVDDLARVLVVPAPETQRLIAAERHAAGRPAYQRPAPDHESHNVSSRMIRPRTADSTQSAVLPKAVAVASSPGA